MIHQYTVVSLYYVLDSLQVRVIREVLIIN